MKLTFILVILLVDLDLYFTFNWIPKYNNSHLFNEPFDFVDENIVQDLLPTPIDWLSVSGSALSEESQSYILFGGNIPNNNNNIDSVYRKRKGYIISCRNVKRQSANSAPLYLNCQTIEEKELDKSDFKILGHNVRTVKFNDQIAALYCDPLWYSDNSKELNPQGKCDLIYLKQGNMERKNSFEVCIRTSRCIGGYSVDLNIQQSSLAILFGIPYDNSSSLLKRAETSQMVNAIRDKGDQFYYGYSVAFGSNDERFVSSPITGADTGYVSINNKYKIKPNVDNDNSKTFGGFGTTIDTIQLNPNLGGVIIGAPYMPIGSEINVGMVFLSCKGYPTSTLSGDEIKMPTKRDFQYFGWSVSRLGDVNGDGTEDFAVSAPFISSNNVQSSMEQGRIFIFTTTADCKINPDPIQVFPRFVGPSLKTKWGFGIAISRGFDLDLNGAPDFLVTSLQSTKPHIFMMPKQIKVQCTLRKLESKVYSKNDKINLIYSLRSLTNTKIELDNYNFQIALDYLNKKDQKRFDLLNIQSINSDTLLINIEVLQNVIDMDLKMIPLKISIKAIRNCKITKPNECYKTFDGNLILLGCDQQIELTQSKCFGSSCKSNLNLFVKKDPEGFMINYSKRQSYNRKLEVLLSNLGPDRTERIFLSINVSDNFLINNVTCVSLVCSNEMNENSRYSKVTVKDLVERKESERDVVRILISIIYQPGDKINDQFVVFKTWGVNEEDNITDNTVKLNYNVVIIPELTISIKEFPDVILNYDKKSPFLLSDSSVLVHQLGSEMTVKYLIKNSGLELKNVTLIFEFPYQSGKKLEENDDGILLYLVDRIRETTKESWSYTLPVITRSGEIVSKCNVPEEIINPHKYRVKETHEHKNKKKSTPNPNNRGKRSIDDPTTPKSTTSNSSTTTGSSSSSPTESLSSQGNSVPIKCGIETKKIGLPKCVQVTCTLDTVPKNSVFDFNFRAWLFTKTFFRNELKDVRISVSLQSNLGDLPKGLRIHQKDSSGIIGPVYATQHVVFPKMPITEGQAIPIWPIILSVIIGILILVVIIVIAYYCGFFKRKRLRKEQEMLQAKTTMPGRTSTSGADEEVERNNLIENRNGAR